MVLSQGLSPELAALKFIRTLKLPPAFHAVWIRNEVKDVELRHIIICALPGLPEHVEPPIIPDAFEGYEVRKVKWGY